MSHWGLAVFTMVLACPLMRVFMMRDIRHSEHPGCHGGKQDGELALGRNKA